MEKAKALKTLITSSKFQTVVLFSSIFLGGLFLIGLQVYRSRDSIGLECELTGKNINISSQIVQDRYYCEDTMMTSLREFVKDMEGRNNSWCPFDHINVGHSKTNGDSATHACFPSVPAEMVIEVTCPMNSTAFYWDKPQKTVKRLCNKDGLWEDHEGHCGCHYDVLKWDRIAYYFSGFQKFKVMLVLFSATSLVFGTFILRLNSLRCTRNSIHLNLFTACLLYNVVDLIVFFFAIAIRESAKKAKSAEDSGDLYSSVSSEDYVSEFDYLADAERISESYSYVNADQMTGNFTDADAEEKNNFVDKSVQKLLCRGKDTMTIYSLLAIYTWVLIEGAYLHSLVLTAFHNGTGVTKMKYFAPFGWGLPLFITALWITANLTYRHADSVCWDSNMVEPENRWIGWIYDVPKKILLLAATIFFFSVLKILWSKLNTSQKLTTLTQSATDRGIDGNIPKLTQIVRASIILVIVYGIWDFKELFLHQDEFSPETLEWWIVMLIDILIDSIRGFFIASVYCFSNSEVRQELTRWYRRRCVSNELRRAKHSGERNGIRLSRRSSRDPSTFESRRPHESVITNNMDLPEHEDSDLANGRSSKSNGTSKLSQNSIVNMPLAGQTIE